jgi:hypothetical protein
MPTRTRRVALLLLFAGLAVHASAATQPPQPPANPGRATQPKPAADPLYQVADEVAADVAKLRGWSFKKPVQKARTTPAEARGYLESRLDIVLPPGRRALMEAFLRTAGLIPKGTDLRASLLGVLDQQVAGYYDPASGTLYVVDRADGMPPFMQRAVLAHELTHALDDQHVGLEDAVSAGAPRTEDADIVKASLAEGSATALMLQYLAQRTLAGRVNAAEAADYFKKELARAGALAGMPRYFNALFGSYLVGSDFLARGNLPAALGQADNRGVGASFLAAWKTPPRSSEQLLHPEKYWDAQRADEPVIADDAAVERWLAKPGRHIVHRDTLGELLTALLTQQAVARTAAALVSADGWTNAGAAGWGGDRFYLLASGAGEQEAAAALRDVQGVWITAWDTEQDRDEFLRARSEAEGGTEAVSASARVGARVAILFVGFAPEERAALVDRLRASPLRFTRSGAAW